MSQRVCIGIDPGLEGALAIIVGDRDYVTIYDAPLVEVKRRPKGSSKQQVAHEYDCEIMVANLQVAQRLADGGEVYAAIERPIPMAGQGLVTVARGARNGAIWEGMAYALGFTVRMVTPAQWKRQLGLSTDKRESLTLARELFPDQADCLKRLKDNGRAEALLLAAWMRAEIER